MNIFSMMMLIALALLLWFLLLQKLRVKPWLEHGVAIEPAYNATSYPTEVIGLGVFIAVVTALFSLFAAAYHMRMNVPDWVHLPLPKLLWINTGLLLLSSLTMQTAWSAADHLSTHRTSTALNNVLSTPDALNRLQQNFIDRLKQGFIGGGCFACAFLIGQLLAWRQLNANGFFFSCSPASAFFYVLTALHGAHLLGGLLVWGKTAVTLYRQDIFDRANTLAAAVMSIRLCVIYWHFLLLLWLALFALLSLT